MGFVRCPVPHGYVLTPRWAPFAMCSLEEAAKYDFVPVTFVLPGDYALFVEVRACVSPAVLALPKCMFALGNAVWLRWQEFKRHPGALWIMKPIGKAQGKGIFLLNKLSQVAQWKTDYRWKPTENPGVRPRFGLAMLAAVALTACCRDTQVEQYVVQRYIDNPYLVGGKKVRPFL